jgi:hypothetical protein
MGDEGYSEVGRLKSKIEALMSTINRNAFSHNAEISSIRKTDNQATTIGIAKSKPHLDKNGKYFESLPDKRLDNLWAAREEKNIHY